jgi:putative protein-disulfide isomerase
MEQLLKEKRILQNHKAEKRLQAPLPQQADLISITYYTDPLCCWSWAFEPEWKKIITEFNHAISWRYCMGGLLPGWSNYHDAINSISRPLQMGPMWMHAAELTGVYIQHNIWAKDPPSTSYPACIAVKCATLQSAEAGEKYLFLLREACMAKGKNIAKQDVLFETASLLENEFQFDMELFKQHFFGVEGREAFRKDLQEVKYYGINRFPSLVIKNNSGNAKLLTGYNTYKTIAAILNELLAIKF